MKFKRNILSIYNFTYENFVQLYVRCNITHIHFAIYPICSVHIEGNIYIYVNICSVMGFSCCLLVIEVPNLCNLMQACSISVLGLSNS